MRIALFSDTYTPQVNGVARTLGRLVKHLGERGHAVALVTPQVSSSDAPDPHAALHVRMPGWRLPFYPELRLARPLDASSAARLRAFAPELVHAATEFTLGRSGLQWARAAGVPVVSSFHTDFAAYVGAYGFPSLEAMTWHYLRSFHARAAVTFCPSRATLQQLRSAGFAGDLRIWSRGVDAQRFQPRHASAEMRRTLAGDATSIVLCVSRAAPEKRLDLLVAAHEQVRREFPDVALVFVGDGPALPALRQQAGAGVYFAGELSGAALSAAYASADIFAFPSSTETFGNVVLEAAASGLPLVAADRGGVTETVIPNLTGLRFEAGNSDSLAECLTWLLRSEPTRRQLGSSARALALARSWDAILDGLIDAYREVIARPQARVA